MLGNTQNIGSLAQQALSAIAQPECNHLYLFLNGLKDQADEARRTVVTCEEDKTKDGINARLV